MTVPKVPEGVEPAQTRRNQPFEGMRRLLPIIPHARAREGEPGDPFGCLRSLRRLPNRRARQRPRGAGTAGTTRDDLYMGLHARARGESYCRGVPGCPCPGDPLAEYQAARQAHPPP